MKKIGLLLIVVSAIWGAIAFNMPTTVTTEGQRIGSGQYSIYVPSVTVNNIGLMEQRRNHLLIAGFIAISGVVLFGLGSFQQASGTPSAGQRQCPHCAEFVKSEAKVCRFCQRDLPSLQELALQDEADRIRIAELAAVDKEAARTAEDALPKGTCPNCEKEIPLISLECKHCKAAFGLGSTWAVRPISRA